MSRVDTDLDLRTLAPSRHLEAPDPKLARRAVQVLFRDKDHKPAWFFALDKKLL